MVSEWLKFSRTLLLGSDELGFDLRLQVETMFEKYNFSGVFIQIQAVLTLYAQGAYGNN